MPWNEAEDAQRRQLSEAMADDLLKRIREDFRALERELGTERFAQVMEREFRARGYQARIMK